MCFDAQQYIKCFEASTYFIFVSKKLHIVKCVSIILYYLCKYIKYCLSSEEYATVVLKSSNWKKVLIFWKRIIPADCFLCRCNYWSYTRRIFTWEWLYLPFQRWFKKNHAINKISFIWRRTKWNPETNKGFRKPNNSCKGFFLIAFLRKYFLTHLSISWSLWCQNRIWILKVWIAALVFSFILNQILNLREEIWGKKNLQC